MSLTLEWLSGHDIGPGFDRQHMKEELVALDHSSFGAMTKGMPALHSPFQLSEIGKKSWNLLAGDLPFPVAVLKRSALEHNAHWMRDFQRLHGVTLAPHAKTSMSPHLWALQASSGCWGLTVATTQQATVAAHFGCRNIILANQLVGAANFHALIELLRHQKSLSLHAFIDSVAGLDELAEELKTSGLERPLPVMIEIGMKNGRAGVRDLKQVDAILDALPTHRAVIELAGIAGFEGIVSTAEDAGLFLELLVQAAELADKRNAFLRDKVILSAGGSSFFDVVTQRLKAVKLRREVQVILRSGCYLTHDSVHYEYAQQEMQTRNLGRLGELERLQPALFVWAAVQSLPEPRLAIVTLGKRDVGWDLGLPKPLLRFHEHGMTKPQVFENAELFKLNDQHGYLHIRSDATLAVGDLICFGISHPCTTFDKWRLIHVVDDDWISLGAIPTYF